MDFEQIFRKKLSNHVVPGTVKENNALWDILEGELGSEAALNQMRVRQKKRRVFRQFAALTLILLGGFGGIAYLAFFKSSFNPPSNNTRSENRLEKEKTNPFTQQGTNTVLGSSLEQKSENNLPNRDISSVKSPSSDEKNERETRQNSPHSNTQMADDSNRERSGTPNGSSLLKSSILAPVASNQKHIFPPVKLPQRSIKISQNLFGKEVVEGWEFHQKNPLSIGLRLFSGPTLSQFEYTYDEQNDLTSFNPKLSPSWGWSTGFMVDFSALHQAWGVGIDWSEYIHQIEQFTEIATTDVESSILNIEVNPQTGDTLAVTTQETITQRTILRHIKHHNKLQVVSIPIEWRKAFHIRRFHAQINAGMMFQIRTKASGRYFQIDGNTPYYSEESLPTSGFHITPTVRPSLGYQISPQWILDLSARLAFEKYSRNSSTPPPEEFQGTGRLSMLSIQCGLRYAIQWHR